MPTPPFDRSEGRALFERTADVYTAARPPYPERVYEVLVERCGLGPRTRALDVGAGSGQATIRLLEAGATVLAVEPSPALAEELRRRASSERLDVVTSVFEELSLPASSFDLVIVATAFHWLDAQRSLPMMHRALRAGGWLALWWNVFGDPSVPDAFHDATLPLLSALAPSPSTGHGTPFGLDVGPRMRQLADHGFVDVSNELMRWPLVLDADQTRRLYATYSNIARLRPELRSEVLDGIERIARERFSNRVMRDMVTALYTGRVAR